MRIYFRLLFESFRFAGESLRDNPLRSSLSLLGVTVGIFSIIMVYTLVDSLELAIRGSFNFLNEKVVYVQKWPWSFEPNYPWWKYLNRPVAKPSDFQFLQEKLENAEALALYGSRDGQTIKYKSSSLEGGTIMGMTYEYDKIAPFNLENGRYFSQVEINSGSTVGIIGNGLKELLFGNEDPIGKQVVIKGRKIKVIGVLAKEGESMFRFFSIDNTIYIPFSLFSRFYNISNWVEPVIAIKGLENDPGMKKLESEVTSLMRGKRGLKPLEDDNFAINRSEMFAKFITAIFGAIKVAGTVIGLFSILVGGFGIANIMFVSVRERTNIIGIQKSLGAKNFFILLQFLFEAVFLCLLGGILGLLLVFIATFIKIPAFDLVLTYGNVITGLVVSSVIGIIAGIVPALMASRMDPVRAIRAK
jgi:putative ABC transport system permease protein